MKKLNKQIGKTFTLWLFVAIAAAQIPDMAKSTNDLYQSALQAYLAGDFDQAILLDSKAIQMDPKDKKAAAFLSVLISEKDNANKTVIWIGGKPVAQADLPKAAEAQSPITVVREKVTQVVKSGSVNSQKLAELESRIQTVAFLMERDSFSQYRELSGAEAKTDQKLDEFSFALKGLSSGIKIANLLFLLALGMAAAALWKSWKNGSEIKKQMAATVPPVPGLPEEQNRVVNIRRM